MATRSEIADIFQDVIIPAYPTVKVDRIEQTMKVFQEALANFDGKTIRKAAIKIVQEGRYFPTVAEIRELCKSLMPRIDTNPGDLQTYQMNHLCAMWDNRLVYDAYDWNSLIKQLELLKRPDDEARMRAKQAQILECLSTN
jgi:hypothetical protein